MRQKSTKYNYLQQYLLQKNTEKHGIYRNFSGIKRRDFTRKCDRNAIEMR